MFWIGIVIYTNQLELLLTFSYERCHWIMHFYKLQEQNEKGLDQQYTHQQITDIVPSISLKIVHVYTQYPECKINGRQVTICD